MLDLNFFISFIQQQVKDVDFQITLKSEWSAENPDYRVKIREYLSVEKSSYFNRLQNAELYNLNLRPQSSFGFISISHCHKAGGFSFSKHMHGFDVEEVNRISDPILIRTSAESERAQAPNIKYLWVAKEAAYKALSETNLIILTDLVCQNWQPLADSKIWSYQIHSEKQISFERNQGYVFRVQDLLVAVYFK